MLAAVEYATGRTAEIVGKPEPQLFQTAMDRLGEGRTLVVGDRVGSDLAAAAAAELDAALVQSDGSDHSELDGFEPKPVAVGETLAELLVGPGAEGAAALLSPPAGVACGNQRVAPAMLFFDCPALVFTWNI